MKIIQITISAGNLIALCEDGTLWQMRLNGIAMEWAQLPAINFELPKEDL